MAAPAKTQKKNKKKSKKALPKYLDRDQVDALFAAPNRAAPTGLRNYAMLTLAYRCGLRRAEIVGLNLRDVKLKEGRIHLRAAIAKGGKEAWVPMDDQARDAVRAWIDIRRKYAAGERRLFTTLKGGPVSGKYVYDMINRYAKRAGIVRDDPDNEKDERPKTIGPHMLRHTYATELLAEGYNIREVQEALRHDDIGTTQLYAHVVKAELSRKLTQRGREPAASK